MKIEKVIFDLGKVLVRFDVKNLFRKILPNEKEVDFFLNNVCTWEWHINQDTQYDTSNAGQDLIKRFPKYKKAIIAFYERFLEMIDGTYDKNVALALSLKKQGIPIYILSNFPGDQFDKYMSKNDFLKEFNGMVVSGKVGVKKPDPQIYKMAIDQFDCEPNKTLFIDDRIENIDAAKKFGIQTIHLINPESLEEKIKLFKF
jgi:2-haloacid dehalogenase